MKSTSQIQSKNPNSKFLMSIICIVLIVNGAYQLYSGVRSLDLYVKFDVYNDYLLSIIFNFFIGLALIILGCIGLIYITKPAKGKLCVGASLVAMIIILLYPIIRFISDLFNYGFYRMDTVLLNLLDNFMFAVVGLSVPVIFVVAYMMNYNNWKRTNPIPAPVQYSANAGGMPDSMQAGVPHKVHAQTPEIDTNANQGGFQPQGQPTSYDFDINIAQNEGVAQDVNTQPTTEIPPQEQPSQATDQGDSSAES